MRKSKKTIKKSIFLSHISIIVISLLITAMIFDVCLRIYVRRQTRIQLVTASKLVQKSIKEGTPMLNAIEDNKSNDREIIKSAIKINRVLKQSQSFLDINYALVGKNEKLNYPVDESNEETLLLQQRILPAINKRKWTTASADKDKVFYFNAADKRYAAIIYPIEVKDNNKGGYLLIYSDMDKSKTLTSMVNITLFSIMLITAIIASIISRKVSEKISYPVSLLSKYAKKIGEREYDAEFITYEDDEVGELAETMYKMAQKLSNYDNTMKTFLQNASHELRTPLMSIQGYSEGIKYGVVEDQGKAVDIIIEESKRLSNLVEDLLYLTKIDSMQDTINFEKINAEDLLRTSIERINGVAVSNDKIIRFLPYNKEITLQGDEEKLIRAIINILGNGLRYAKKYVDVELEKYNSKIIITIKDDGLGFEGNNIDNIFDRFYKGKNGNYGLGLAITKSIIEKHKGTIKAENNIEGGACFKITLGTAAQ